MARETVDNETGEIIPTTPSADLATLTAITRAEIDMQITTARAFPRKTAASIKRITELATLDEETAEECCYALVRKKKGQRQDDDENKAIEGPSIRLAEIAFSVWGNARADARVISVNRAEKYVEAEGVFHDLETNAATRAVVRRRISTKGGYLFSDDMIVVTGNAACSIAKRNAILAGIPKGVYRPAYRAARKIIAGDATTLSANRAKVYKAFATYGVTPAQIHELLEVGGEADVTTDHIALLRATFASIKNGESTVADAFAKDKGNAPEGVADPLGVSKPEDKVAAPSAATSSGDGEIPPAKSEVEAGEASTGVSPAENKAPEKPADGPPQTEASTQPAKAESPPTQATTPAPSTPEEYRAHVLAYVAEATGASALEAKWRAKDIAPGDKMGDRSLRQKLNIDQETFNELEGIVKARCVELKGAPT